jgi:hypothetical protein
MAGSREGWQRYAFVAFIEQKTKQQSDPQGGAQKLLTFDFRLSTIKPTFAKNYSCELPISRKHIEVVRRKNFV